MKYAVIKVINGNFSIHAEGFTDLTSAKVSYHDLCKMLWNAPDVIKATVAIVDEQLDTVDMIYREYISHPQTETQEPNEE